MGGNAKQKNSKEKQGYKMKEESKDNRTKADYIKIQKQN